MFPKKVDLKQLVKFYDKDGDGCISYPEFVSGLTDKTLSKNKQIIVEAAWNKITGTKGGCATGQQLVDALCDQSACDLCLNCFEGTKGGNLGGQVSWDEFCLLYREVAVQVPNDEYFEKLVSSQWKETCIASIEKLSDEYMMHLVGLLRQRLVTIANGSQEEYKLRNLFRTFDVDGSGAITLNELAGMTGKLGVAVTDDELVALMRWLDINKSGVIEFEEFERFLIEEPYTKYKL